jgi:hypothetical protein
MFDHIDTGKRGWVELPEVVAYLVANPAAVTPAQKTKLMERFKGALLASHRPGAVGGEGWADEMVRSSIGVDETETLMPASVKRE